MISEDDIASEADSEYKFKNSDDPEKQYRDITNGIKNEKANKVYYINQSI
jgi:hypothetical protein